MNKNSKAFRMWKNFFNVAIRNIRKNSIFSLINIAGLAIGLASAILIILFIAKEISFDRFHEHSDRIYRMYVDGNIGDQKFTGAWTSYAMAPTLTSEIDEIEEFVRMEVFPQQLVWNKDVKTIEDNVVFVDSAFFRIFSIELLKGDRETVLKDPYSVVISREKARQYFGDENPVGQTLEFNHDNNFYLVTGVMDKFPDNSHFFCDFLLSMSNLEESRSDDWFSNSIYSYVLLKPGVNYRKVEAKMNEVLLSKIKRQLKTVLNMTPEEWLKGGNAFGVFLQPLVNIHLNPEIDYGHELCFRPVNDRSYIYVFSLIAFFILLIASINFMNLSTARSAVRAREIGLRKVVGSDRSVLIIQFLSESLILSLLALLLALFIVEISLPWFNRSMALSLSFLSMGRGLILLSVLLLTLIVGVLSGFYPAFYLSRFDPITSIRGRAYKGKHSSLFRSIMVIIQFTISVGIIVCTLVVSKQVSFLVNMDPGFRDKSIVVIDRIYPLENKIAAFCEEVEKIPGVKRASNSSSYLGVSNLSTSFQIKGTERSKNFMFDLNFVDPSFQQTYGFSLWNETGRFFKEDYPDDTLSVIINHAAVVEYELEDPLNTVIQAPRSDGSILEYKVVGVVEDFHHSALTKLITPYMFMVKTPTNAQSGYISIRFDDRNIYHGATVKKINKLWYELTGDEPFQFFYLNEELDKYYREEERTGKLSAFFSILAIFIACLGLIGLTIFNTEQRKREIAIRKAMGATLRDILFIISGEIVSLLLISIGLAWAISFLFMKNWLQVFPYNIGFTPGVYILAATIAAVIALLTVNALTWRASRTNPVKALYHE